MTEKMEFPGIADVLRELLNPGKGRDEKFDLCITMSVVSDAAWRARARAALQRHDESLAALIAVSVAMSLQAKKKGRKK